MKLKPLSKDEELAAIPVDEPVLVQLEPEASGVEDEPAARVEKAEKPLKVEREEPEADDGVKALQAQMAEMQRASATETARLARERDEALRERDDARTAAADTEADLISNGLTSAQSEVKAARAALKTAIETGDIDAQADAQERIGRGAADIREFERAAATIAEREKAPKPEPRQQEQPSDINVVIDRMQLMPAEKAWLKEHSDALTDPGRKVELDAAYFKATRKGFVRGTPDYFQFLETEMEYTKPAAQERQEERQVMPAAPVSRDSRSSVDGKPLNNNQVRLTPQQREFAQMAGVTDREYAAGLLQMESDKQSNPEKYARR